MDDAKRFANSQVAVVYCLLLCEHCSALYLIGLSSRADCMAQEMDMGVLFGLGFEPLKVQGRTYYCTYYAGRSFRISCIKGAGLGAGGAGLSVPAGQV